MEPTVLDAVEAEFWKAVYAAATSRGAFDAAQVADEAVRKLRRRLRQGIDSE